MPEAFTSPALLLVLALMCLVIGLAWLALAMDVHWQQVRGNQPLPKAVVRALRVMGGGALLVSLVLCLLADHPSMAALVWIMGLAASALIVTFTFTWQPRVFAPLVLWVRRD